MKTVVQFLATGMAERARATRAVRAVVAVDRRRVLAIAAGGGVMRIGVLAVIETN